MKYLSYILFSFGFCCIHKNWSHETSVWSSGFCL